MVIQWKFTMIERNKTITEKHAPSQIGNQDKPQVSG